MTLQVGDNYVLEVFDGPFDYDPDDQFLPWPDYDYGEDYEPLFLGDNDDDN